MEVCYGSDDCYRPFGRPLPHHDDAPFAEERNRYLRHCAERGATPASLKIKRNEQWTRVIGRFLRWCIQTNRQLRDLQAVDIDAYFVSQTTRRWSRVSVANTASALRVFLRYAGKRGMLADSLAGSICRPRLYRQESLPYAPNWSDVHPKAVCPARACSRRPQVCPAATYAGSCLGPDLG